MKRPRRDGQTNNRYGSSRLAGWRLRVEELEWRSVPSAGWFDAQPVEPLPATGQPPVYVGLPAVQPPAAEQVVAHHLTVPAKATFGAVVANLRAVDVTTLSVAISWGDGAQSPGTLAPDGTGGYNVIGIGHYQQPGLYPITVHVTAPDCSDVEATGSANVLSADVTTGGTPPINGGGGGPFNGGGGGPSPPPPAMPGGPGPFGPDQSPEAPGNNYVPQGGPPPAAGQILWVQTPDPRPTDSDTRNPRQAPAPATGKTTTTATSDGASPTVAVAPAPIGTTSPSEEQVAQADIIDTTAPVADPPMIPGYLVALRPGAARAVTGRTGPAAAVAPTPSRYVSIVAEPAPAAGDSPVAAVRTDWDAALADGPAPVDAPVAAAAIADTRPDRRRPPEWWQYLPLCVLMVLWDRWAADPRPRPASPTLV